MENEREKIRAEYCKQNGYTWIRPENTPMSEYVEYLENKLIAQQQVKNTVGLDDVSKQSELLKAFVDFYNYRNTGDKTIYNDEIEIFIDRLQK